MTRHYYVYYSTSQIRLPCQIPHRAASRLRPSKSEHWRTVSREGCDPGRAGDPVSRQDSPNWLRQLRLVGRAGGPQKEVPGCQP